MREAGFQGGGEGWRPRFLQVSFTQTFQPGCWLQVPSLSCGWGISSRDLSGNLYCRPPACGCLTRRSASPRALLACSFPGEKARSWGALGEARPGQSSLSAGALRYRAPERPQGSPASSSVWREDPGLLSKPCRKRRPFTSRGRGRLRGCVLSRSSFVTLWTIALRAPLSMGFSRQEY